MQVDWVSPQDPMWREVLASLPHDTYHLPEYVEIEAEIHGARPRAALVAEGSNQLFVPLVVRRVASELGEVYDVSSPYGYPGPLLQVNDDAGDFVHRAVDGLIQSLRTQGIVSAFIRLNPLLAFQPPQVGCVIDHGDTVPIDLALSDEELWRQTRSNHKRDIKKAKRTGHRAIIDQTWSHLDEFVSIYEETMERVNASAYYYFPRQYYLGLRDRLGDHVHLCIVSIADNVAAAGLFLETAGIVQYHLGGTRDAFLDARPTKLMFDFIRSWAKERGNKVFHLGGGFGGAEDSLLNFKTGFSKDRSPFSTWRLITDPVRYQQLCDEWERKAGTAAPPIDGFFPAYRKPV